MKILKYGSSGPSVAFMQLALNRAGFGPLNTDGIFGSATRKAVTAFQSTFGLNPDGICGKLTHNALSPWYLGFVFHKISAGDTFYKLSEKYGCTVQAIKTANPQLIPENLLIGTKVVVPLPFDVVPTEIPCFSELIFSCIKGLTARYPFILRGNIGKSVMGKPIPCLYIGNGDNKVLYNASHHANEWITSLVLLKFAEDLCKAYADGNLIFGQNPADIMKYSTICLIPVVNPDGIDLVTGELTGGEYFNRAVQISKDYPRFPFPNGWSANISGTDLNLQYPAGWEQAKINKYKKGIISPAPSEFVGNSPLSAPESRAMYDFTLKFSPFLTLSYHSQGEVIYWRYLNYEPPDAERIAKIFSTISGYSYENTPFFAGYAGYKDWFIESFNRPGYTVEVGRGVNPLPISDFPDIYEKNLGILTLGAVLL